MASLEALGLEPPGWSRAHGAQEEDDDEVTASVLAAERRAFERRSPFATGAPLWMWTPAARARLSGASGGVASDRKAGDGAGGSSATGKLEVGVLVVSVSYDSSAALTHAVQSDLRVVATVVLPEQSLAPAEIGDPVVSARLMTPTTFIYESTKHEGMLVLPLQQRIPADRGFAWTKAIFDHIQAERVLILDCLSTGGYQRSSSTDMYPPVLRCLQTRAFQSSRRKEAQLDAKAATNSVCPFLEAPNALTSLGAAILTHCEVFKVRAEVFVSVTALEAIGESLVAFDDALDSYGLLTDDWKSKSVEERVAAYVVWWRECGGDSTSSRSSALLRHADLSSDNGRSSTSVPATVFM